MKIVVFTKDHFLNNLFIKIKEEDPIPKVNFKPPPVVPKETYGVGVNKYVYYVCNARKILRF